MHPIQCVLFVFIFLFFHIPPSFFFRGVGVGGSCFLKRENSGHLHVKQVVACMNIYVWSFRSAHAFPYFVFKTV